jgi:hypothetical protein
MKHMDNESGDAKDHDDYPDQTKAPAALSLMRLLDQNLGVRG